MQWAWPAQATRETCGQQNTCRPSGWWCLWRDVTWRAPWALLKRHRHRGSMMLHPSHMLLGHTSHTYRHSYALPSPRLLVIMTPGA